MHVEAASSSTGLKYVEQEASGLRLCLYAENLPPDAFRVLASQAPAWYDFSAELRVVGASHAVSFSTPAGVMTEVLACFDPQKLAAEPVLAGPSLDQSGWRGGATPDESDLACYYRFDACPVRMNHILAKRAAQHACRDNALHVTFPARQRAVRPFTFLSWETSPDGMGIYSLHTYPADDLVICSRSSFSCVPLSGHLAAVPEGMPQVAAKLVPNP